MRLATLIWILLALAVVGALTSTWMIQSVDEPAPAGHSQGAVQNDP